MISRAWLGCALLAGCLGVDQPERAHYVIEVRRDEVQPRDGDYVLEIRPFRAAPSCATRQILFVDPEGLADIPYYTELLVPPAVAIGEVCRRWLEDTGAFRAVTGAGSTVEPDFVLEGELDAFHGHVTEAAAHAVVELTITVMRRDDGELLVRKSFSRMMPIEAATAVALVDGWRLGLRGVLDEVERVVIAAADLTL